MKKILIIIIITIFTIVGAYSQAPANDECSSATEVFPDNSCTSVDGTLLNATPSASIPSNIANDVWFKFIAQSTTQFLTVTGNSAWGITPVFYVYESCSATTPLFSTPSTTAVTKDLILTGLTVGATYYYRVTQRNNSYVGITNFNFTTCITNTQSNGDVNDICQNAIELNVTEVCNLMAYSNTLATATTPSLACSCGTTYLPSKDVWFKAIVPANGRLNVISGYGTLGQSGVTFYRGTCPSGLTEVPGACNSIQNYTSGGDNNITVDKSGLTPGETIYIRMWAQSTATLGTYQICASTPPACGLNPAAADFCADATPICNLNGYCGNTSSAYTPDNVGSPSPSSAFPSTISIENNSWLSFNAKATTAVFTVYVSNCVQVGTANGIQIAVYDKNCGAFTAHATWSQPDMKNSVITATNLVVGNDYLIMIDGSAGAHCDYIIATNSGVNTLFAGNDTTICQGAPLTLSANGPVGSTYTWTKRTSAGLSSVGTGTTINLNPGPTDTTTYIVTVSGGALCFGLVDSLVVSTKTCACPTATISYVGLPWCTTSSLQNVSLSGTGTYTGGKYSATPAGLAIDSISGQITPNTSSAGNYLVTYTIAPTALCAAEIIATTNVAINAAPTALISYSSSPYCISLTAPQPITFAGTTGGTYGSTTGLSINPTSGAITPNTSTAGVYLVAYSIAASGGCSAVSDTANVVISAMPSANISYVASPYCTSLTSPQAVTFIGTTGGVYSSTTGLTIIGTSGAITPNTSTAGTYIVTYTSPNSGGCAAVSDTANVIITKVPTALISYSSAVFCTALSTSQPVTLTGTGAYTGGSYSALPTGLSLDVSGGIMPSTSTPQLYTITYSYPASGGCAAGIADTTITITAIPTANISYVNSPYCTTLTAIQSVTLVGTTSGIYSTSSGLSLNASNGNITPSTSTAGNYVVTYTIAANGGCPLVSDTANVTIKGKPTISITGVNNICNGQSTTLKASGATSYLWDNTSTIDSITVSPTQNTTYLVTGTTLGCSDTASYPVTIKPLPTLSVQGLSSLCIGDSIPLIASGADSYLWSPQASLTPIGSSTIKAFPQMPTTYKLVGTLNGCVDSISYPVSVFALPIITIQSNISSGCEPLSVSFSVSSLPQAQQILWNFGNSTTSTALSSNAQYLNDGLYDVSANVIDVNGCKSDTTEVGFITVFPKPVVDFTFTPSQGMVNEVVTFTSSYTQTPSTWMWQFGDGNSQNNTVSVANYSYEMSNAFTITHIVQTEHGCLDTASHEIVVLTRIIIPNVLTPNNDGFNDTFIIDGLQFVDGCYLKIYNRWGGIVYESTNYKNDWDGGSLADGTYFYILTIPSFLKAGPFSGSVTLFK